MESGKILFFQEIFHRFRNHSFSYVIHLIKLLANYIRDEENGRGRRSILMMYSAADWELCDEKVDILEGVGLRL